jgi:hypothetical protein
VTTLKRNLFFILLSILIGALCSANCRVIVYGASTPRILVIYTSVTIASYPAPVLDGISAFGNTTIVSAFDANKYYSLDYLRQYDLFVVADERADYGDYRWSYYPILLSNIAVLASEGKSFLAILSLSSIGSSSPLSGWGISSYYFTVPSRTTPLQCEIKPSNMTHNITNINIPSAGFTTTLLLVGRNPLVLSPVATGWPDPQADFAVYGYYDNITLGKYVVISKDLFSASGEVGVFFSNTLYWLTNKDIPPPPSVFELGNLIEALNQTLADLNQRALELNGTFNTMDIMHLNNTVNQLNNTVNQLDDANSELTNKIADLKDQVGTQQTIIYVGIIGFILSIIALVAAIAKRSR